eukprot:1717721-Rhodomonas_salina.2
MPRIGYWICSSSRAKATADGSSPRHREEVQGGTYILHVPKHTLASLPNPFRIECRMMRPGRLGIDGGSGRSRDWLDSASLVEEAEAEHEDAFPASKQCLQNNEAAWRVLVVTVCPSNVMQHYDALKSGARH